MEARSGSANAVSVSQPGRNSWLLAQVVFAIVGAAVLGHFAPELALKMKPLGGLFIDLIKLVTPAVIFLPIVTCGGRWERCMGNWAPSRARNSNILIGLFDC